jgi:hypothetical protein
MKTPDDLDRQLGEWLQEGPTRPPEAPLEGALQHATAHPRRRDPLRILRRDPMAARPAPLGLRPALVLVVLGLLLGVAGALVVGSRGDRVPSPGPSTPPASPAPSASAAPSAPALFHVAFIDEVGSGATIDIADASGKLVGARAAGLDEREPNPGAPSSGDVTVKNVDAATLWISWVAGGCPDADTLDIDATGRTMTIRQPPFCGGDTLGVGRQLVLTFSGPIAAADVTARLVAVGAPTATP